MKITGMIKSDYILAEMQAANKREALLELSVPFMKTYPKINQETVLSVLMEREKLGSTGIGEGIAIPHGKLNGLDQLVVCFGRSSKGIEFNAMDGKPVHLFFLLLAPENSAGQHLKTLAKISKMLKDGRFRTNLMRAGTREDIAAMIDQQDDMI